MKSTRSFSVHGIPPNCSLSVSQSVSHSLLITLIAACAIVKKIGFFSFVKTFWVLVQWDFKIWYFFFLILISINRYVMVFIESWSILDVQFIHFSLFWDIVSMEGHHSVTNPALQLDRHLVWLCRDPWIDKTSTTVFSRIDTPFKERKKV